MSGVAVIGSLLLAYSPLTTVVPADRIKGGALPKDVILPAIAVTSISATDWNLLKDGTKRRVRERVQVTVLASDYQGQVDLIRLVRLACAGFRGDVGTATAASVLLDGKGPDFLNDDASIWLSTQDFSVSFNEPA
jgi:hypothetical protein